MISPVIPPILLVKNQPKNIIDSIAIAITLNTPAMTGSNCMKRPVFSFIDA